MSKPTPLTEHELLMLRCTVAERYSPHHALGYSDVELGEKVLTLIDVDRALMAKLVGVVGAIASMTYSGWEENTPADDAVELCTKTLEKMGLPIPPPYRSDGGPRFPPEVEP